MVQVVNYFNTLASAFIDDATTHTEHTCKVPYFLPTSNSVANRGGSCKGAITLPFCCGHLNLMFLGHWPYPGPESTTEHLRVIAPICITEGLQKYKGVLQIVEKWLLKVLTRNAF